jgi:hypothetical protein
LVFDALEESFSSIKKANDINKYLVNIELSISNYNLIKDIYKSYISDGIAFFNAGNLTSRKDSYINAFDHFKKAASVWEYMYMNGWGNVNVIYSINLYYLSKSAIYTENESIALFYCKLLVDKNIYTITESNDVEQIYRWLVYYYKNKNDDLSLEKYTRISNIHYQKSDYFSTNYIDYLRSQKKYSQLLSEYKNLFNRGFDTELYRVAYFTDYFNYLKLIDSSNQITLNNQFEIELSDYINIKPNSVDAKLLMAKFYINKAVNAIQNNNQSIKPVSYFLNESNIYLKAIVKDVAVLNKPKVKVAVGLLVINLTNLGKIKEANYYKNKYKNL